MAVRHPSAPAPTKSGATKASGVQHVKTKLTSRFTVVSNELAQHPHLSVAAKGLGLLIQSLPSGARISIRALSERLDCTGETVIARLLRELEQYGFLSRELDRTDDGRLFTSTKFYNHPSAALRRPRQPAEPDSQDSPDSRAPEPKPKPKPEPKAESEPETEPCAPHEPEDPEAGPPCAPPPAAPTPREPITPKVYASSVAVLTNLRLRDSRLFLSEREVHRLASTVAAWLQRGRPPRLVTHRLTHDLPEGTIHHPAGLVGHRLEVLLPPHLPLPPEPAPTAADFDPIQNCDNCDRAFRALTGSLCPGCTHEAAQAARAAQAEQAEQTEQAGHAVAITPTLPAVPPAPSTRPDRPCW